MTASAVLTPGAQAELRDAIRALDNNAARRGLRDAIRDAARLIGDNPTLGARRPSLAGLRYRFWSIPRYRCLMVYTDATVPPRILRVLHTSRDLPPLLAEVRDKADDRFSRETLSPLLKGEVVPVYRTGG